MAKKLITGIFTTLALLLGGTAWGAAPFVVDAANGTVTDTSTGLMWEQCAAGLIGNDCTGTVLRYTWVNALGLAATQNAANYKGYSDWRVPNVHELRSLVNMNSSPTIDTVAFPGVPASVNFWSTSSYATNPSWAWVVFFGTGGAGPNYKTDLNYVRLVRSGQYFGSFGLFSTSISGLTVSGATLSATSSIAATGYWLVVPRNATPPSAEKVIAGVVNYVGMDGGTVITAATGSGAMAAKTPATFLVSQLSRGIAYDLYVVAKESTYQTTSNVVGPIPFSTSVVSTSAIVIDPSTPTKLYAGLDGTGVYASADSGTDWATINTVDLTNLNVRALAIQNSNTLFAATYDGGVFKGTLSSGNWTWAACGSGLGAARLRSLTLDAGGNLYAGSETGIFKGHTDCRDWTAMNNGLPQ